MAGLLYDSRLGKLLTLDVAVEVYPAHGAGSLCGRNMSKETSSTIGVQRQFNYALRPMSKEAFTKMVTTDLPEAPKYFSMDAQLNREGAAPLERLPRPAALNPEEVAEMAHRGSTILDVRSGAGFGTAHIPGAVNIGLAGQFASWAGALLAPEKPLIIVAEHEDEVDEAVVRLARVGIEQVRGYLAGGMYAWDKAGLKTRRLPQMPVDELRSRIDESAELKIVDVRRPAEYATAHIPGAVNVELAHLEERLNELDPARPTAIVCAGGYRSSAAASLLSRRGFRNLFNIVGGTEAWVGGNHPVESVPSK
jgi:rhodanese-related sulfurtransferase